MAEPLSPERLAEIRERLAAATPGEWSAANEHELLGPDATPAWCVSRMDGETYLYDVAETCSENEEADAEFIAHAPTDLADLLAEVELWRDVASGCERAFTAAQARIDAALALHVRREAHTSGGHFLTAAGVVPSEPRVSAYCERCHGNYELGTWPCPTVKALRGDDA